MAAAGHESATMLLGETGRRNHVSPLIHMIIVSSHQTKGGMRSQLNYSKQNQNLKLVSETRVVFFSCLSQPFQIFL
jgi:hypothetical protein